MFCKPDKQINTQTISEALIYYLLTSVSCYHIICEAIRSFKVIFHYAQKKLLSIQNRLQLQSCKLAQIVYV